MEDLRKNVLITDVAGRELIGRAGEAASREWWWVTSDGAVVAQAGALTPLDNGRYRFEGTAPDTRQHTGREATEADLLAEIGADLGWRMPIPSVEMPGGASLTR